MNLIIRLGIVPWDVHRISKVILILSLRQEPLDYLAPPIMVICTSDAALNMSSCLGDAGANIASLISFPYLFIYTPIIH